jgi:hypothetical protein
MADSARLFKSRSGDVSAISRRVIQMPQLGAWRREMDFGQE